MNAYITPAKLNGEITAPTSKSYAHRLMIAAFLSGDGTVENVTFSKDAYATVNVLKALGGEVKISGNSVKITRAKSCAARDEERSAGGYALANAIESGSTLRFLLPVAAALGKKVEFTGEEGLLKRPFKQLTDCLNERGAKIDGLKVSGKLKSGEFKITASVSSQFISGLLFALPLLDGDSEIVLDGEQVSKSYVDITIDVLKLYGIEITPSKSGYFIKGNQTYKSGKTVKVEGDWSGAAFYLSAGAINGEITVKGLNPESVQGDRKIIGVLKRFGASVTVSDGGVTVKRNKLNGTTVDLEDIPDLGQIISVVAAYATGETVLKSVNRLKIKESDRLKAITDMLSVSGIAYYSADDELKIYGGAPKGGSFSGGNDHRTVMSCAVLAANAMGETQITDAEAINKSYPDFFKDYKILGGTVNGDI